MVFSVELNPMLFVCIGGALKLGSVTAVVFVFLMTFAMGAQADTIWDEGTDGPLSTAAGSPTVVTLVSSSDQVIGLGVLGLHVFQFTVPAGKQVDSMLMDPTTGVMEVEVVSAAINCPPRGVFAGTAELLDGSSCAPALPPGDYTFIVNVLSAGLWNITIASDVPVELQSLSVE